MREYRHSRARGLELVAIHHNLTHKHPPHLHEYRPIHKLLIAPFVTEVLI